MTRPLARVASALATTAAVAAVTAFGPAAAAGAAPVTTGATATSASAVVSTVQRNTSVSRSMTGVRPSAYVGRKYVARYERTRRCIVSKESGGNYRIRSASGTYRGAYQFNSYLARATALKMGNRRLASKPMNSWSRFHQDKAFWIVWNKGKGRGNWPTARGC